MPLVDYLTYTVKDSRHAGSVCGANSALSDDLYCTQCRC